MKRVAVIGAGTMGNGIAHVFAQYGSAVTMVDVREDLLARGRTIIAGNLDRQVKKGTLTAEAKEQTLKRITLSTDLATAVADCALVVEAATEAQAIKEALFRTIDQAASPETILASNTSSISITALGAVTHRPDKVIGMHFMNPVPVMKLVEVIRGHATSNETTATVLAMCTEMEKTPVEVNDYPGFVANRILLPMINEAAFCVMEGVATPDAIDTVMKLGMNHPMGPLALADFIGLDVCVAILNVLHDGLGDDKYRACPLLKRLVAAGHLGRKTGRGFFDYSGKPA